MFLKMVTLKKIGFESKELIQEILDDCPTYMLNCEGVKKRENAAEHELTMLPPGANAPRSKSMT